MQGVLFKGNRAQVLVSKVVFLPFMALFVICFCMSVNSSPSSLKCVHVLIYSVEMAEFVGTCIEVLSYSVLLGSSCIGDEIGWIASERRSY